MTKPKRHHWWPMTQSRYWTDKNGQVFVTCDSGRTFRTSPVNIGVESELYTRFAEDGEKDTQIEEWFAETIDGPATKMINHLLDESNLKRFPLQADPQKAHTVKSLGFRVNSYVDRVCLPMDIRQAISNYLAALLVRHPTYIEKLTLWHSKSIINSAKTKAKALDNMIELYKKYTDIISKAVFLVSKRVSSAEYIYTDGGILVEEPWRKAYGIPFDIHAPLTPDIAIEVLPIPHARDLDSAPIMEANNKGISRQNRIMLEGARRFVFSRQAPPVEFIKRNFGVPAPKNIGYKIINGRLETNYYPDKN